MPAAPLITNHKKGISIAAIGGVMIAFDVPLVRLAQSDPWTTLVVRGPLMAGTLFIVWMVLRYFNISHVKFFNGWHSIILGILHAIATVAFVLGIYYTTTANLVFITACNAMIALMFSTLVLKESHPKVTWLAIVIALGGIVLITVDDLILNGGANTFGNLMALLCAVTLAAEVLFIRRSGKNLVYAPAIAAVLAALFAIPFMLHSGFILEKPHFLIMNSILITPAAMAFLALAPRYITAPQAAMFYLLETVLAPLFVWIIFNETVSNNTLLGGVVVISAIIFHSAIMLKRHNLAAKPLM